MKIVKVFAATLIALGMVGCATTLSQKERAALQRVYIAPYQFPEPVVAADPSTPELFAQGALGELLYDGTAYCMGNCLEPITYMHALEKNNIDVAALFQIELTRQLSDKGIQIVDNAEQADAILNVKIDNYGAQPPWASTGYIPNVWPRFILARKGGGVMWRNWTGVSTLKKVAKEVKSYPLPDYLNDPQLLDRQIRNTNRLVIQSLLETL